MERLKNMGLKRSFFLLSVGCLTAALMLTAGICFVCMKIEAGIPSGGVAISYDGVMTELEKPSPEQFKILEWLGRIRLLSAVLLPVSGLGLAGVLFYRLKLKTPIDILKDGTERIRRQDLDFSIPAVSGDELGQICAAFETMREELLKTNQELWRQTEERRRLNAAFSHDLRNPVTVLKGTVKLLLQGDEDAAGREQALKRLETYTLRIEQYVEAMSSIQRLEQMPVLRKSVEGAALQRELQETAQLLVQMCKPSVCVSVEAQDVTSVFVDHGILLTVAENLIGNAARFARREMKICLRQEGRRLFLSVWDDGPGFPAPLLKDGPKPFGKVSKDAAHFGMGLYSCQVLCGKHGGTLRLENGAEEGGARATAVFAC